jgi:hypothetical protein
LAGTFNQGMQITLSAKTRHDSGFLTRFYGLAMIAGFSAAFCVAFGAAIAYLAKSYPRHREAFETMGGILLIGGLGLLGFALECAVGHP